MGGNVTSAEAATTRHHGTTSVEGTATRHRGTTSAEGTATRHHGTTSVEGTATRHRGTTSAEGTATRHRGTTSAARRPEKQQGSFRTGRTRATTQEQRPSVWRGSSTTREVSVPHEQRRSAATRAVGRVGRESGPHPERFRANSSRGARNLPANSSAGGPPLGQRAAAAWRGARPGKGEPGKRDTTVQGAAPAPRYSEPALRKPAGFEWSSVFGGWKIHRNQAVERGDIYAARAYRAAIGAVSEGVGNAHRLFGPAIQEPCRVQPEAAHQALIDLNRRARYSRGQDGRAKLIERNLAHIENLTCRKDVELAERAREFASLTATALSRGQTTPVAQPEVLRSWLLNQANLALAGHERARGRDEVTAQNALYEHRYFKLLFDKRAHEGDPWSSSRAIRRSAATRTRGSCTPILDAAHAHLLQVMVDPDLRPAAASSGETPISRPRSSKSGPVPAARRELIAHQVSSGKLLSVAQAEDLAYRIRLADSQGHLGVWAATIRQDFQRILALYSNSPQPPAAIAVRPSALDLKVFEWMLSALESAGYL